LPGLSPVIASTELEAKRFSEDLNELANTNEGLARLSSRFGGTDFSHLPLDKPLSPEDFPDPSTVESARSRTEVIVGVVRKEKPTLRQLLSKMAAARGHYVFAGTPEQVAELIEDWFYDGVADGINLMPPVLPKMLDVFIDEVVPLLQKKGIFRTSYQGDTLREHYGLERPDNIFRKSS
jgi:alkanesulfonate monooxygenase SsuD/methylene tetrahydromethanopterin reductase-like flavin-dependent oxidoreductase (luciferase family)